MSSLFHDVQLKQITWMDKRYYRRSEGVFYPSSTTILSAFPKDAFLMGWIKENGTQVDDIMAKAAAEGTNVHDATELYDKGFEVTWADDNGKPRYNLTEWECLLRYVDFREQHEAKVITRETQVFSDEYCYAGTVDFIAEIDGVVWLLDIKTSNGVYDTYHYQTASYAQAIQEMFPHIKIDKTGILWLKAQTRGYDSKGKKMQGKKWQVVESDNQKETGSWELDFEGFKNVHNTWKLANKDPRPLNVILPDRVQMPANKIKLQTVL